MKLIVGYDKALASQCFRRNLREIIRPESRAPGNISVTEIDYFAERLAESSVFGRDDRLGSPWMLRDDAPELAKIPVKRATRAQLQRCEDVANNVLILEGVVGRAGASISSIDYATGVLLRKRMETAGALYRKASHGTFHTADEKSVLQQMSTHTFEWVHWLSYLPGNDFLDLLSRMSRSQIYIS